MIECRSVFKVPGLVVSDLSRDEQIQTLAETVHDEISLEQLGHASENDGLSSSKYDLGVPREGPSGEEWISCSVEQMSLFIAEMLIDLGTSDICTCDEIIAVMLDNMAEPASEAVN